MATIPIPSQVYPPGVIALPQTPVPVGIDRAHLTLDAVQWTDPQTLLSVQLWLSYDSGVTWLPGGGGTARGEPDRRGKTGLPLTTVAFMWTWPEPDNPNRRVKGTLTLSGGSLQTSGVLTLE